MTEEDQDIINAERQELPEKPDDKTLLKAYLEDLKEKAKEKEEDKEKVRVEEDIYLKK